MKYLALLVILFTAHTQGTEVVRWDYADRIIHLTIVRVGIESFYTVKMENQNRIEMDLMCGTNFTNNTQRPILRYRNYNNQVVDDFNFDNVKTCNDLKDYLQKTFEGISEDSPLRFELDPKTKKVTKIIYPEIDPYYEGPYPGFPNEETIQLN